MVGKPPVEKTYSLDELASLAALPRRTVRYYIQIGLLDRAEGETRAARYSARHAEQLIAIRRWTEAGLSLDRIRDLISGAMTEPMPARARGPGSVEVWSHVVVADGVEVTIEPSRAGLSPEELRNFVKRVAEAYQAARKDGNDEQRVGGAAGDHRGKDGS